MNLVEIKKEIFREYDIRGIYGEDINIDVAYTIGRSFGTYIKEFDNRTVIVGYDNRVSSPVINNALIRGIIESGSDVISLGLVTTPMYYYAKKLKKIESGIMITASHNPKEYNGFKISFDLSGNAYGKFIEAFRKFTELKHFDKGNGFIEYYDIKEEYLNLIRNSVDLGKRKIKAVVDCGNGTGSIIIKDILNMFDIEYELLYCDSNPDFPNHHPDPAVKKNQEALSKKVVELGYDLGIGIDGDADRVGIVDNKGNILGADIYMLLMYRHLLPVLTEKKAIYDVKCSKTLIDELDKLGLEKLMYRTGNSYMNMKINQDNYTFGGEYSGHVWFKDKFPGFDDGIYAGLRMIELLSKNDLNLDEMLNDINKYYQTEEIKIKVSDTNKFEIVNKVKEYCIDKHYIFCDIDGVRATLYDGWALVRASNTGPNLTVRFEAKTLERMHEIEEEFTSCINKIINEL